MTMKERLGASLDPTEKQFGDGGILVKYKYNNNIR
jgi:hypothetical protein